MKSRTSPLPVAVVTGAARGIGRTIAKRLAQDGYAVAMVDINADALANVQREIEELGAFALCLSADLSQLEDTRNIIVRAAEWGPLSALINNAGRVITHPYLEVTEEEWDAILTLDLKTVFFAMQFAARYMRAGGRMVNISSVAGRSGRADQAPYAAAKSGVISLTRSAALSFAPLGITVNAVCPGVVDTPITRSIHEIRAGALGITPEESLSRMVARIPLGRIETPEDVAGAVSFLCSPDAAYMTGQSLNVCGGMEMD
jgi:NAD(P)-dependent dehydrogenase (short-subunit alcohol dehydrogenase family)